MEQLSDNLVLKNVGYALAVTLLAGLATGIGSAIAFFARRTNYTLLAWGLSFSAGVMLFVSFTEILPKAQDTLAGHYSAARAAWLANAGFFGGLLLMALIDWLVPKAENPHELRAAADLQAVKSTSPHEQATLLRQRQLWRMGTFTALAIAIHNFPEGMATFLAALEDPRAGTAIAIAIALHNIPEGVSVSVPLFYATGRRSRAFALSLLSGLAEPVGAIIAALTLHWLLPVHITGIVFAGVAGVMVYISIDELLPTAREYGKSHEVVAGIVLGMAVMAISLLLLM